MVSFLKKRLQVFVSSTFLDLKKERQAAVSAILNAGHIPAGMELFTAGDQSQMDVIKQWIDESDVYCLILGSRYGSIEPETGKSYTHLEYEYAISIDKPLFACVIKDSAIDSRVSELGKDCLELKNPSELENFKNIVLSKMSSFWSDTKDIELAIMKTLQTFSRREDLIGWVKGNEAVDTVALTDELARLSKENADLREENNELKSKIFNSGHSINLGIHPEKMKKILENINLNSKVIDIYLNNSFVLKKELNIQNLFDFFIVIKHILIEESLQLRILKPNTNIRHTSYKSQEMEQIKIDIKDLLIELCVKSLIQMKQNKTQFYTDYCFFLTENGYQFLNWIDLQLLDYEKKENK
ncbi:MAG: DUF4062 domain-containing protein [Waterburya sp.]